MKIGKIGKIEFFGLKIKLLKDNKKHWNKVINWSEAFDIYKNNQKFILNLIKKQKKIKMVNET